MKTFFFFVSLLFSQFCFANMASPIRPGTYSSSAFGSRNIDILSESIHLKIDKAFNTAKYSVIYRIFTDSSGKAIPLLFHAKDYSGDFKVWIDDIEINLLEIPEELRNTNNSSFSGFSNSFSQSTNPEMQPTVTIYWEKGSGRVFPIKDLKYFESNLTKGEHTIRVEYTANVWTDVSGWIKQYKFQYSLSPAKHWKSFGNLQIVVDASELNAPLTSNLGKPAIGSLNAIATYNFTSLPADFFEISYSPEISSNAKNLLDLGPFGITLIATSILALFHLFLLFRNRKRNPEKKHSRVLTIGSILISLFFVIFYIKSFDIIDNAIGASAGRHHGYNFMVIVIFPIVLLFYWLLMKIADKIAQKRFKNVK